MDIENLTFTLYYVIFYAQLVICASLVFPSERSNQMNESYSFPSIRLRHAP